MPKLKTHRGAAKRFKRTGTGKIIVIVGGRMLNKKAVTKGDAIPTGSEVVVDGMTSPDTYEVSHKQ